MGKVYRCRDVDVSDVTKVPLFAGCDFECRGETNEDVLKIAIQHVREEHSEPVNKLLGQAFEDVEGAEPSKQRTDIPDGPAKALAGFMRRVEGFFTSGSARRVLSEQLYPTLLLPKLREAVSDE